MVKESTREYWEKKAKRRSQHLIREGELFTNYWVLRYLQNLKYLPYSKRILDIGCGDAKYFIKLIDKFEEFCGIELSKVHFISAKKIFPNADYIVANGSKLPFKDKSFDVIISFGAFEHDNIDLIFGECYRVLKGNGVLLFSVPNYVSFFFPYCYIFHTIRGDDRIAAIGHHYTKKELIIKLRKKDLGRSKLLILFTHVQFLLWDGSQDLLGKWERSHR